MAVEVIFCVNVDNERCLEENEIDLKFDDYHTKLLENDNLIGAIIIRSAGNPDARFEDELGAAVQNLCFLSLPDLIDSKHVVVRYFSYYGYLRLDPEGAYVLISGDFVPSVRVLREELIPALCNCGQRFIKFFRRLRGDNSEYEDAIKHLEAQAEVAQRVIDAI